MSQELLTLVVKTKKEDPPATTFVKSIEMLVRLLNELSHEFGTKQKRLHWVITKLSKESPATVGVGLVNIPSDFDWHKLQNIAIEGFDNLNSTVQLKRLPKGWNDDALIIGRGLSALVDMKNITGIAIQNGRASVELTSQTVASIDKLIIPAYKKSEGSIDGKLDLINVHEGLVVGIYRTLDNRKIKASFAEKGEKAKEKMKEFLGKRVYATGTVSWNKNGEPTEILIKNISVNERPKDVKSIFDLYGSDPDFTGGLTPEEFIRKQRDE